MQSGSRKLILGVQIAGLRSGPRGQAKGQDWRVSSSVSPTHSPEQSGAGLSAGAHADLLKLPAVRHRGDHLGQLLLLALQHSVDMLGGHLLGRERRGGWDTKILIIDNWKHKKIIKMEENFNYIYMLYNQLKQKTREKNVATQVAKISDQSSRCHFGQLTFTKMILDHFS